MQIQFAQQSRAKLMGFQEVVAYIFMCLFGIVIT